MRYYFALYGFFIYCFAYPVLSQTELEVIPADTSFSISGFDMIEDSVTKYRLVLTGENHRFTHSNQIIKIKMMLFLHEHGFKHHLLELGRGIGFLANEYILTGDQHLMDILNEGVEDELNPMFELLEVLERFNRLLPMEDKIQIHGVDYTRYPFFSTKSLQYLIEKSDVKDELKIFYEDLTVINSARSSSDPMGFLASGRRVDEDFDLRAGFKSYRSKLFELTIRNLIQDFYRDSSSFRIQLKENYNTFEDIIKELHATLDWYHGEGLSIQSHIRRERHLEQRILRIVENDSTAKLFGQFGRCHIRQDYSEGRCYAFDMASVSERLQKNSLFKDHILSIPIFYSEDGEVKKNKNQINQSAYDYEELLQLGQIYLWEIQKDGQLVFPSVGVGSKYAIVNTFPGHASMEQILNKSDGLAFSALSKSKRKRVSEDHFQFNASGHPLETDWNTTIGHNLLENPQLYFGLNFTNIDEKGWQTHLSFMGVIPNWHRTQVADFRYSNWRFQIGQGYNFIYRKRISFYSDLGFFFGFAKVREYRSSLEGFSFDVKDQLVNFRNGYLGFSNEWGIRYKMDGFSVFGQAGYQVDLSDQFWKVKSNIVENAPPTSFSAFFFSVGFSIYINDL